MKKIGEQSLKFENTYLLETSTVAGKLEKEGPLGDYFDVCFNNNYIGESTWEKGEMALLDNSIGTLLNKAQKNVKDIDLLIGGDLNNQIAITNYVLKEYEIPFLGIYSACSTFTEGLIVGSTFIENGLNNVIVSTSSHNSTSERQFRNPTEYGGQKNQTTTFTATASGSTLLTNKKTNIKITNATIGKVIDSTILDPCDMGRIMAPAAADTLLHHLKDFNVNPNEYDLIVTGDLSKYGKETFLTILKEYDIELKNYEDTGLMLYDTEKQPVFSGGSGAGCITLVTLGYLYNMMMARKYHKILLIATGALLNPVMTFQKETIPAIAHAVVLERI